MRTRMRIRVCACACAYAHVRMCVCAYVRMCVCAYAYLLEDQAMDQLSKQPRSQRLSCERQAVLFTVAHGEECDRPARQ